MVLKKVKDKQEFLNMLNIKRKQAHSTELLQFLQGYVFSQYAKQHNNAIIYVTGCKIESYYNATNGKYETIEQVMKNVYYTIDLKPINAKDEQFVARLLQLVDKFKKNIDTFPIPTNMENFIDVIKLDKKLSIYKLPLIYNEKIELL